VTKKSDNDFENDDITNVNELNDYTDDNFSERIIRANNSKKSKKLQNNSIR